VKRPCEDFLAGARLAREQNGNVRPGESIEHRERFAHRDAAADDLLELAPHFHGSNRQLEQARLGVVRAAASLRGTVGLARSLGRAHRRLERAGQYRHARRAFRKPGGARDVRQQSREVVDRARGCQALPHVLGRRAGRVAEDRVELGDRDRVAVLGEHLARSGCARTGRVAVAAAHRGTRGVAQHRRQEATVTDACKRLRRGSQRLASSCAVGGRDRVRAGERG
jgi:hypothetical protein